MTILWVFNVSWCRCKLTFRLNLHLSELQCAVITDVIISAAEYRCSGALDNIIENHYSLTKGNVNTSLNICGVDFFFFFMHMINDI